MNVFITRHAVERWLQRIADYNTYKHLDSCNKLLSGCSECCFLQVQLRNCVNNCYKGIQSEIIRNLYHATEVCDPLFLKTIEEHDKQMGRSFSDVKKYYKNKNAVFVIVEDQRDRLISVMNAEMIEGSIIKFSNNHKEAFQSWKFRLKLNGFLKKL